jgi:hypothetical protein
MGYFANKLIYLFVGMLRNERERRNRWASVLMAGEMLQTGFLCDTSLRR